MQKNAFKSPLRDYARIERARKRDLTAVVLLGVLLIALIGGVLLAGRVERKRPVYVLATHPCKLDGDWLAQYEGGPLFVRIRGIDNSYEATLVTGNAYVPAGKVVWHGDYRSNPFAVQQVVADPGYRSPRWVDATVEVHDANRFHVILPTANGESIVEFERKTPTADGAEARQVSQSGSGNPGP